MKHLKQGMCEGCLTADYEDHHAVWSIRNVHKQLYLHGENCLHSLLGQLHVVYLKLKKMELCIVGSYLHFWCVVWYTIPSLCTLPLTIEYIGVCSCRAHHGGSCKIRLPSESFSTCVMPQYLFFIQQQEVAPSKPMKHCYWHCTIFGGKFVQKKTSCYHIILQKSQGQKRSSCSTKWWLCEIIDSLAINFDINQWRAHIKCHRRLK